MSRVSQEPRLPIPGAPNYDANLFAQLTKLFREFAQQINLLSEGRIVASTNAMSVVPTGKYQIGDFVRNTAVTELGTAGNKYVLLGWVAVDTTSTFKECRALTGN